VAGRAELFGELLGEIDRHERVRAAMEK